MVKAPSRRRAAPGRNTQVHDRATEVSCAQGGARRVLVNYIREDPEAQRFERSGASALETALFVIREVQLPQQHGMRGLVERGPRREPTARPTRA
jgi:hypothetical protein